VTLRGRTELPSLRQADVFGAVREALAAASRTSFRVLQFSAQRDHVHLLVEADGEDAFRRGLQGLAIRVAKAINRVLGRVGAVWGDRYHARQLATPREVRNALVYVLQNFRKHMSRARGLDPRSSAAWFDGWRVGIRAPAGPAPVVPARTWLGRVGWRVHGLVGLEEAPRARTRGGGACFGRARRPAIRPDEPRVDR
jgi:hypothetical protein